MQIHELAQQIRDEGVHARTTEYDSLEAGQVLEMCVPHEFRLGHGEFAKTDYGQAYFELGDVIPGNELYPSQIDFIEVRHMSNLGFNTKVGNIIRRMGRETSTAVVSVYRYNEIKAIRLKPEDERWGTIVGCVRDAVIECEARRTAVRR